MVRRAPRSLEGYICLFGHQGAGRAEVLRFLDGQIRKDPQNPRPRLYAGIVRTLGGEAVDDHEWRLAIDGFARERDVTGEVYATTSLISARCIGRLVCDGETRELLWHTGELARASGKVDLQQVAEIWAMKVAFAVDDMDAAAAAEARLQALGPPRSTWLRSESLQARAHLAALLLDHERQRTLYRDLLDTLDADDPRRPAAVGGMASAVAHLALRGLESPTTAERLLREAIDVQQRAGLAVLSARTGYLATRVQLAILLGPTAESLSLLRSTLAAHLARSSGPAPMYSRLALAEFLATVDPPRLDEAMEVSQAAVEHAFQTSGDYEKARTLVLRSRMAFRLGHLSPGRADGLAALDLAERLREQQRSMPLRLRYAQSLSFAYQSLAGALTRSRAPGDDSALDAAFQVMERLRARGLMETLLAEGTPGEPVQVQPPRLAQVQGELGPGEALLSFQLWQPEPSVDAPYREGSSWVTVITRERVEAFPVRAADDLARRIRAWTGLLERRDGADRMAGARLDGELLRPALAALPPRIDRLIVVPDGPLHRLPFDALSEGPGTPYVAERFGISIEPSAALWLRFRAAPRQPPGKLLVLADPAEGPAVGSVLHGSSGVFGALAHARREAQAALAAFPGGSELRTGPPASEAFLKAAGLRGVSMLHFATHAVTDEQDPEHAAVVLAPGSAWEDGRLEPGEIARLPLEGKT
ncbi:MAG: CHAT domain-containing protein, partial [Myxococcaceae bacterium]